MRSRGRCWWSVLAWTWLLSGALALLIRPLFWMATIRHCYVIALGLWLLLSPVAIWLARRGESATTFDTCRTTPAGLWPAAIGILYFGVVYPWMFVNLKAGGWIWPIVLAAFYLPAFMLPWILFNCRTRAVAGAVTNAPDLAKAPRLRPLRRHLASRAWLHAVVYPCLFMAIYWGADGDCFDPAIWRLADHTGDEWQMPREAMIRDLTARYLHRGMSYGEVLELLGAPEVQTTETLCYQLQGIRKYSHRNWLVLSFDRSGTLIKRELNFEPVPDPEWADRFPG